VEPADVQPQLDPGDLNRGAAIPSTRNYAPAETAVEVDRQPLVPLVPLLEGPSLDRPKTSAEPQSVITPRPKPSLIPFARPAERPASSSPPEDKLRLVPDPDVEPLDLRKQDIPQLLNPSDRHTRKTNTRGPASVPISWPTKTAVAERVLRVPASSPVTDRLDDSVWKSLAK
jgi:hypothetical protein